jgi:hypothetical protein
MAVPADDLGPEADSQGTLVQAFVEAADYPLYVVTAAADEENSGCLPGS